MPTAARGMTLVASPSQLLVSAHLGQASRSRGSSNPRVQRHDVRTCWLRASADQRTSSADTSWLGKVWSPLPPLHRASRRGDRRKVKELLESGVPVDQRDRDGSTALMHASEKKKVGEPQTAPPSPLPHYASAPVMLLHLLTVRSLTFCLAQRSQWWRLCSLRVQVLMPPTGVASPRSCMRPRWPSLRLSLVRLGLVVVGALTSLRCRVATRWAPGGSFA